MNGLVLAGGRSTRMGTDKGLINYHGKPQREHLFDLLQELCKTVYTSCRKGQDITGVNNPLIDFFDIPGPINGIMSAFHQAPGSSWLIVAVDMPKVNKATLELLLSKRDQNKIATCFYNPELKDCEPLLTLWEPIAYPLLRDFTEKGNVSPQRFLRTHNANVIPIEDPGMLANFNSPEDIAGNL
ncbi:MAG TPA: molybdenum cofactor guanylyltransferase [Cyclobacteriaceae bacterium]|nr:molybdenum cofactor guanylyltransferase [Cyclobacteriaceae bacterium]